MRPLRPVLLAPVLALAASAPASATTYCVADPACPAGGVAEPTLAAAATSATGSDDADAIRLGPGSFGDGSTVLLRRDDTLTGAGRTSTTVSGTLDIAGSRTGPLAVRALTVRMTPTQRVGIQASGGLVQDVDVDGSAVTDATATGFLGGQGPTFAGGTIRMAKGSGVGPAGIGGPTVRDAVIDAPVGAEVSYYGMTLLRTRITANVGVDAPDGAAKLDTVVIRLRGANATGVAFGPGAYTPYPGSVVHATIVGDGAAGSTGISARASCQFKGARLTVDSTVVAGVSTDFERRQRCDQPGDDPAQANLTVTRSAYDPSKVVSTGAGTGTFQSPVTTDPQLGSDLVPLPGSGLVDAGDPAEAAGTDVRGLARPFDGNGDGTAVADVGAFELQPLPAAEPQPEPPAGDPAPPATGDAGTPATGPATTPGQGGVAGQSETSKPRRAVGRPVVRVTRVQGRPRVFVVRVTVRRPKGASVKGATVSLDAWARKRHLGLATAKADRNGRATFRLELPRGVARRTVGIQAQFGGTRTLKPRNGRFVGLY